MIRWALLLLCLAAPGRAEEVVAGLSQTRVSINTNFHGTEILIFGAVKRQDPIPAAPLQVAVTVAGPSAPLVVRRKARRMGIWINTDAVEVDRAPSFYAVATSAPWSDTISETEDLRHAVSVRRAIRSVGAGPGIADASAFTEALIRLRERTGFYQTNLESVTLEEATLFSTSVRLPANLTEGNYTIRFFLTRENRIVDMAETALFVRKVGLERFLYALASEQPLIYGVLSLVIAIAAGWGASAGFRYLRG